MLYATKQINSSLLKELVSARGTMSLQESYAKKFVEMVSFSTFHATTATTSVETDALQHAKWNTDISVRDLHLMAQVNVFTREISTLWSTAYTNLR